MPVAEQREGLIQHLAQRGVAAAFHYVPLHDSPGVGATGAQAPDGCQLTSDVAARLVRLPLFSQMTDAELDLVVDSVTSFRPRSQVGSALA